MIYRRGECASEQVDFGCQELYTLYYTVKMYVITSHMIYILSHTKSVAGLPSHSWYTLLKTRGVDKWMVLRISTNTDLFTLNFCTHIIYIYTNNYPQLQATQTCISCPVASESREHWPETQPTEFPRSLPHLGILGAKVIGTQTHKTEC